MSPSLRKARNNDQTTRQHLARCLETSIDLLAELIVASIMGNHQYVEALRTLAQSAKAFHQATTQGVSAWCTEYAEKRDRLINARIKLAQFLNSVRASAPPEEMRVSTTARLQDAVYTLTFDLSNLVDLQFGRGFANVYKDKALMCPRMDSHTFYAMLTRCCRICGRNFRPEQWTTPSVVWRHQVDPYAEDAQCMCFAHNTCVQKHAVRMSTMVRTTHALSTVPDGVHTSSVIMLQAGLQSHSSVNRIQVAAVADYVNEQHMHGVKDKIVEFADRAGKFPHMLMQTLERQVVRAARVDKRLAAVMYSLGVLDTFEIVLPWGTVRGATDGGVFAAEETLLHVLGVDDAAQLASILDRYRLKRERAEQDADARRVASELERDETARRAAKERRASAAAELRDRHQRGTVPYSTFEQVAGTHPNVLECIGYECMLRPARPNSGHTYMAGPPLRNGLVEEVFNRLETLVQWLQVVDSQLGMYSTAFRRWTRAWLLEWLMQPRAFRSVESVVRQFHSTEGRASAIRCIVDFLSWLLCDQRLLHQVSALRGAQDTGSTDGCVMTYAFRVEDRLQAQRAHDDSERKFDEASEVADMEAHCNTLRWRRSPPSNSSYSCWSTASRFLSFEVVAMMRCAVLEADPSTRDILVSVPASTIAHAAPEEQTSRVVRELITAGSLDYYAHHRPRPSTRAIVTALNVIGAENAVLRINVHCPTPDGRMPYDFRRVQRFDASYSKVADEIENN